MSHCSRPLPPSSRCSFQLITRASFLIIIKHLASSSCFLIFYVYSTNFHCRSDIDFEEAARRAKGKERKKESDNNVEMKNVTFYLFTQINSFVFAASAPCHILIFLLFPLPEKGSHRRADRTIYHCCMLMYYLLLSVVPIFYLLTISLYTKLT